MLEQSIVNSSRANIVFIFINIYMYIYTIEHIWYIKYLTIYLFEFLEFPLFLLNLLKGLK